MHVTQWEINAYLRWKVRRVATESNLNGSIEANVVSQVLFLNLISFPKNAAIRAARKAVLKSFFEEK